MAVKPGTWATATDSNHDMRTESGWARTSSASTASNTSGNSSLGQRSRTDRTNVESSDSAPMPRDVEGDAAIGVPGLRTLVAGEWCRGVQSDAVPHVGDPVTLDSVTKQELAHEVGAAHLESFTAISRR